MLVKALLCGATAAELYDATSSSQSLLRILIVALNTTSDPCVPPLAKLVKKLIRGRKVGEIDGESLYDMSVLRVLHELPASSFRGTSTKRAFSLLHAALPRFVLQDSLKHLSPDFFPFVEDEGFGGPQPGQRFFNLFRHLLSFPDLQNQRLFTREHKHGSERTTLAVAAVRAMAACDLKKADVAARYSRLFRSGIYSLAGDESDGSSLHAERDRERKRRRVSQLHGLPHTTRNRLSYSRSHRLCFAHAHAASDAHADGLPEQQRDDLRHCGSDRLAHAT